MRRFILRISFMLALVFAATATVAPALAEKPSGVGIKTAEKHKKKDMSEKQKGKKSRDQGVSSEGSGVSVIASEYFGEQTRMSVHKYYADQFRGGHCPPGLAKKGNGCMPPGQAKKWKMGQPLPKDVIFYDLPSRVLDQLGSPPSRHRFVRVAKDILLIAEGTGVVVDAIEDIGREIDR